MSSMRGVAILIPLIMGTATAASTQVPYSAPPVRQVAYAQPSAGYCVGYAINDWRRLRRSGSTSFADYARFLVANPGWPGEDGMRRSAERVTLSDSSGVDVS